MKNPITQSELKRLLDYNPSNGVFTWKARRCGVRVGKRAGTISAVNGYERIGVKESHHLSHRLAWLYVHGYWPTAEIDHVDRNRTNNRIDNLREATRSENQQNKPVYRNSKTGVKGVNWHKQHRKYIASIQIKKTRKFLGLFGTISEAAAARRVAAEQLHKQFAA